MTGFLENAANILETAVAGSGEPAILIDPAGGIRIISETDWSLEALLARHGAREGYRVTRRGQNVEVTARSGNDSCRIETTGHGGCARAFLFDRPQYRLGGGYGSTLRMLST